MTEKHFVGGLFLLFVVVRLRWPRGKDERDQVKPMREWLTSATFTLSLLFSYVAFLWTTSFDNLVFSIPYWIQCLGGVMALVGIILLEWVHQALGHHFSPHLELREDHKIVQSGPYKWVRHPMYTSGLFFLIGNGILSCNWMVLLSPTCTFVVLLVLRIHDEEKMLRHRFGEEWDRYTKKTGFLVPKIFKVAD